MKTNLKTWTFLILTVITLSPLSFAQETKSPSTDEQAKQKVRYRKAKNLDFESILIKGRNKRAELSVVTGDVDGDDEGLLKLREDFLDHMAIDLGVEVQ